MVRPAKGAHSAEVAGVLLVIDGGSFLPILAFTLLIDVMSGEARDLLTPRGSLGTVGIFATGIASLIVGQRILRGSRRALWAGLGLAALYVVAFLALLATIPWTTNPGHGAVYVLMGAVPYLGINGFILSHATLALRASRGLPPRPDVEPPSHG
jgi:hypothetical protein